MDSLCSRPGSRRREYLAVVPRTLTETPLSTGLTSKVLLTLAIRVVRLDRDLVEEVVTLRTMVEDIPEFLSTHMSRMDVQIVGPGLEEVAVAVVVVDPQDHLTVEEMVEVILVKGPEIRALAMCLVLLSRS